MQVFQQKRMAVVLAIRNNLDWITVLNEWTVRNYAETSGAAVIAFVNARKVNQ